MGNICHFTALRPDFHPSARQPPGPPAICLYLIVSIHKQCHEHPHFRYNGTITEAQKQPAAEEMPMAVTNYDLFWEDFQNHCELSKLQGVLDELELDPVIELIRRHRKFSGRTIRR